MKYDIFDWNFMQIYQGNTADISIALKDATTGEDITIAEGEEVLFTVKNRKGETVIQKHLTSANLDPDTPTHVLCQLDGSETSLPTGDYLYDCVYSSNYGQVTTFISSWMQILPAVGQYES